MDKVAALKAIARDLTQSLVDLKELYDDRLLDEMKCNEHLTNLGIALPAEFFDEMKAEEYGETWYHIQDMKSYA